MTFEDCKKSINEMKKIYESINSSNFESGLQGWFLDMGKMIDGVYDFLNDVEKYFYEGLVKKDAENKNPLGVFVDRLVREISNVEYADILNRLREIEIMYNSGVVSDSSVGRYRCMMDRFQEMNIMQKLKAYQILKHLKEHNKTLVIMGPNGSGKTSFANHLRFLDDHIKVIPALKPLRISGHVSANGLSISAVNAVLYSESVLSENILQQMVVAICKQHDDVARRYRDNPKIDEQSMYEKIKSVFDDFFNVELNSSRFSDREMMAKKSQGMPFSFNDMSDGERAAFFYISTVMTAPEYSFIIVDEPENHLNPAIYNKIWDRLISIRGDCQFIFISHAVDFIKARINCDLVKIDKYIRPNDFHFKFLGDSYKNLPMKNIVEIVGSRKPILFCEGDKDSHDYKVYEILFGKDFTVIPAGTCEEVKNSVIYCNRYSNMYDFCYAIGIVDYDLRSDEEIDKLNREKIYTLCCNEIEMLLLDEDIFKKALVRWCKKEEEFEEFKVEFFGKIKERKNFIVKRFVKKQIEEKIRSFAINDKKIEEKEEFSLQICGFVNDVDVCEIWNRYEKLVDEMLIKKDYEMALRYCCLQHKEILNGIANSFVCDYARLALGVLEGDEELIDKVKMKYCPSIKNVICANNDCKV